jgi:hypothetical protein
MHASRVVRQILGVTTARCFVHLARRSISLWERHSCSESAIFSSTSIPCGQAEIALAFYSNLDEH